MDSKKELEGLLKEIEALSGKKNLADREAKELGAKIEQAERLKVGGGVRDRVTDSLLKTLESVAVHLSKRRGVIIRFRKPCIKGAWATTSTTPTGTTVVDLDPDLDPERMFECFLKSVAHARLHRDCTGDTWKAAALPPESVPALTAAQLQDPTHLREAREANELALKWLRFSQDQARPMPAVFHNPLAVVAALAKPLLSYIVQPVLGKE